MGRGRGQEEDRGAVVVGEGGKQTKEGAGEGTGEVRGKAGTLDLQGVQPVHHAVAEECPQVLACFWKMTVVTVFVRSGCIFLLVPFPGAMGWAQTPSL